MEEGTLEPVQYIEGEAAPIVPLLKDNSSSIFISCDFQLTSNPIVKLDKYPLSKVEDLFETLVRGKLFSKLHLRSIQKTAT